MSLKLPVLFLVAIVIASFAGATLPASNALIARDYAYLNDNHLTSLYGNTMVCGDHMCAPGEWDKMQADLTAAQLGHQGRNETQTTTAPITPPPTTTPSSTTTQPSTTMSTGVTPKLCAAVKDILSSTGVSTTVISQVMADLGCS